MNRAITGCLAFGVALALAVPAAAEGRGVKDVSQEEVLAWVETGDGPVLLDVRTAKEYTGGHIPGAVHIPHDELAERIGELDERRERGIVLYCESGRRAGKAAGVLLRADFDDLMHLDGDMAAWRDGKHPIEK